MNRDPFISLTSSQIRYFKLHFASPATQVCNVTISIYFSKRYDEHRFNAAVNCVTQRHALLRARVSTDAKGKIGFRFATDITVPVTMHHPGPAGKWSINQIAEHSFRTRIAIGSAPMLRIDVVDGYRGGFAAVVSVNHLICDGRSLRTIVAELATYYDVGPIASETDRNDGNDLSLQLPSTSAHELRLTYFRNLLVGHKSTILKHVFAPMQMISAELPMDFWRLARAKLSADSISITAVLAATLAVAEESADLLLKTVTSSRGPNQANSVGNLINLLPIRVRDQGAFGATAANVCAQYRESQRHELPYWQLTEALFPELYLDPFGPCSYEVNVLPADQDVMYETADLRVERISTAAQILPRWAHFTRGLLLRPRLNGFSYIDVVYDSTTSDAATTARKTLDSVCETLTTWIEQ
jgi:hypothetical protein